MNLKSAPPRKLRMGMVGGGPGAFIGAVHRMAAQLDSEIELVCGAFSGDPARSRVAGAELRLAPARVYDDFARMMVAERERPAAERMDFVSIVTPNHMHCAPALSALENGFHVVIDKPLCLTLDEAHAIRDRVRSTGLILAVTHPYVGYPMVKEARSLVAAGKIGAVRKVLVEYRQGWLARDLEATGQKQADWRTDPARAGTGAIGDIGTHAAHLAEYVSGSRIASVNAAIESRVPGRRVDDDAAMLLRFDNGANGVLIATQIAAGEENDLTIRVYGDEGGIEWSQVNPNTLVVRYLDKPIETYRTGWDYCSEAARRNTRTPSGHPEGFIEAFANLYREASRAIRAHLAHGAYDPASFDFPDVEDGLRGMQFINAVQRSSSSHLKWTDILTA